jgi:AraC family transcriptional regulator, positive regulator of tynA and feaB
MARPLTPPRLGAGSVSDIIFSTKSLHRCERFSNWHDVACKVFVEHDCQPDDRRAFEAEVRSTSLGSVELSVYSNSSMTVWRNERQAARATGDAIFACVQVSGKSTISQDGRNITLEAGGLTLVNTQRPYTFTYSKASEQLVAQISRREIEARIGDITQLMAIRVDDSGVGRLASEFLQLLAARAENISSVSRAQLGNQAVDLLSLALSSGNAGKRQLSSVRLISLLRLKSVIEGRLSACETTCAEVARAAGMSVRYANQLLATEARSLERYIWERRLEKCRQAFDEPGQDGRTITEIAYGWGFNDVSHFGRIFKARHGVTPRDYRAHSREMRCLNVNSAP